MSKLETVRYAEYNNKLPQSGRHIIGTETNRGIIVYQAYRPSIAKFAMENQFFGGDFKLSRMSWIKTNFLWMMYRSGWASKDGQEHVLAVEMKKEGFKEILSNAVSSSYDELLYENEAQWKEDLSKSSVRLQWDPDHAPLGVKLQRKAIQLGLKGELLKKYSSDWILSIEDITEFVRQQSRNLSKDNLDQLYVIKESVIDLD